MPIYLLSPRTILVVEVTIKLKNMMDDKKIEDAAKQHSEESYISDYFQACYKDAFKAGAKWAINEVLEEFMASC